MPWWSSGNAPAVIRRRLSRSEPPHIKWFEVERRRPPSNQRADEFGGDRRLRQSVVGVTECIDDAVGGRRGADHGQGIRQRRAESHPARAALELGVGQE